MESSASWGDSPLEDPLFSTSTPPTQSLRESSSAATPITQHDTTADEDEEEEEFVYSGADAGKCAQLDRVLSLMSSYHTRRCRPG